MTDPPTGPPVRIDPRDPGAVRAKNALMIASQELRLFAYRQPYHLGYDDHREALKRTLRTEFRRTLTLPAPATGSKGVFYLVIMDGEPILIPEAEVLPFVLGVAAAKGGQTAARRLNYRTGMLTTT